ncbi:hypothetical protein XENOCAPTIV_000029 [Xenoophorus captivus]|uniref:SARAH domain-containing protein n=1 Tax=Xenoophorus captivus TaxID=1517983 RepID=A0ABV0Q516_9TELE
MTSEASSSDKTPSFEMTWGSSTSSGYCSEEDSDTEFEQYFTARTSFFPKTRKPNVTDNVKKNKDGSYTGFVKVQFKLARPVSVPAPKKGGPDAGGRRASGVKRRTSFYLPKDASKHLHISSHDERPLRLRLNAGPNEKVLSFVLKENETGEVNVSVASAKGNQIKAIPTIPLNLIDLSYGHLCSSFLFLQWHAFSMPELKNFLLILQREEEEHVKQIVQRYTLARTRMLEALSGSTPG